MYNLCKNTNVQKIYISSPKQLIKNVSRIQIKKNGRKDAKISTISIYMKIGIDTSKS